MSVLFRNTLSKLVTPAVRRNFTTTVVKRSSDPLIGHPHQEAIPGANLPFGINNRYKLALVFILYFGSGFSIPFLVVRSQLLRKSG